LNGIIIINKVRGETSHRVVKLVRSLFPGVKAGHSGTLDPMATGILPVCLGRAARLVEYIIELYKVYRAEVTLGITTDTEDADGAVVERTEVPQLEKSRVKQILEKFTGSIEQQPPVYSAVKYRGKPLYHWTRSGKEVPRRSRKAEVYRIELLQYTPERAPHLVIEVKCSRGTYIRTLATDIGKEIGCGAHLSSLTRLSVGPFTLDKSYTVEEAKDLAEENRREEMVLPMDAALGHFPRVELDAARIRALKNGQTVVLNRNEAGNLLDTGNPIRVYSTEGDFKALVSLFRSEEGLKLKTKKYLAE